MFKRYRPVAESKSHLAKVEKKINSIREIVRCHKCNAANKTLRKISYQGKDFYYCEDCIKKAMKENKDVRKD